MSINETVLEMHFHNKILELIDKTLGLSPSGTMNFYKYSPQREVFIGFDQAYISSPLSESAMFNHLKSAASTNNYALGPIFVGLFLQFKIVQCLYKKSKYTPSQISSAPFFRSSLSTQQNINTGQAQHELLYNLSANPGAFVYYACPMLFNRHELYQIPNLNQLRLVDVASAAGPYLDNKKHHIFFDNFYSNPIWKSEPKEGVAISPEELADEIRKYVNETDTAESARAALNLIERVVEKRDQSSSASESIQVLDESFTLLEIWPHGHRLTA